MEAICKKSYPYEPNDAITLRLQIFYSGENYKYEEIFYENSGVTETWYFVKKNEYNGELFTELDFNSYFISFKKQRKIKLENLANEQDINRLIYGN